MKHITLVIALETRFDVLFETSVMSQMRSLGNVVHEVKSLLLAKEDPVQSAYSSNFFDRSFA